MKNFKEYYEDRCGEYPGEEGEYWSDVLMRISDIFADYVNDFVKEIERERITKKSN